MSWTNVPKPVNNDYMNVNPMGREQYDQSDLTYDSAVTYYDGINPSQWTDISKPNTSTWSNVAKPT